MLKYESGVERHRRGVVIKPSIWHSCFLKNAKGNIN